MDDYKISLGASLDESSLSTLQTQIDGLKEKIQPVKIRLDTSTVDNQIKDIKSQLESLSKIKINLGQGGSKSGNLNLGQAVKAQKELLSISNQIERLSMRNAKMKSIGADKSTIATTEAAIKNLRGEYSKLYTALSQDDLSDSALKELNTDISNIKTNLVQLDTVLKKTESGMMFGIKDNANISNMGMQIRNVETEFASLNTESQEVSASIEKLKTLMSSIDSSDDIESVNSDYMEFKQTLTTTTNKISSMKQANKEMLANTRLLDMRKNFTSEIDSWATQNSGAMKQFGAQINDIKSRIATVDAQGMPHLRAEWLQTKHAAEAAGVATQNFGDRFKAQMQKLTTYFSASFVILKLIGAVRQMYDNVLEVDTAMTGLYRVTNLTAVQYTDLYSDMTESAKKYGSTLKDIINSTASWVRLGFDAQTSAKLSEVSAMYQHVTDLDESTAVTNLVTAYKGYQDKLLDISGGDEVKAMTRIADIYDKLGNEMPVTAAQVGEGMTKAASVMEMSGATLEQAAGMITGGGSVTQDFSAFGNALKVSALRVRGKTFCLHTRKGCMLCA